VIEVESLKQVVIGFALLAPGFLIMFGRSRFVTGRMPSVASSVFEYLMVSSIYFAAAYPLFEWCGFKSYLSVTMFLFILPLVIGLILGFVAQKSLFRKLTDFFGLNPVHPSPTAWDFVFSGRKGYSWVIINLNSGGRYFGVFGQASMASSDLDRRDVFIEDVRDSDFKPVEVDGRKRGVWVNENDIRSIEIIKDN
jgi:hypothetical protein